ncbi:hypothetical protein N7523_003001 [Penicillium sp. IBT 18751x]|nr:hypothetical protein N7523_003001 [Penicillium sp. IBT 18751x]
MAKSELLLSLYVLFTLLGSLAGVHAAIVPQARPQASATPYPQETGLVQPLQTGQHSSRDQPDQSHRHLEERQAQIVFGYICPEEWNNPIQPCYQCGGEDPNLPGRCYIPWLQYSAGWRRRCRCDPNETEPINAVNSTTVVDGTTGIICWEPVTYSDYSDLQASTTMTITEPATLTNGDIVMETEAVDLYAGGVAWYPACLIGPPVILALIAAPAALPPGARADNSDCEGDDQTCDDCGGDSSGLGLCSEPPQAGCPCREKEDCPNEPMLCSDPNCGGDNGQSQCAGSGDINGCTCCPDTPPDCTDNACGGGDNQECSASTYDKCICTWVGPGGLIIEPPPATTTSGQCYYEVLAQSVLSLYYNNNPASVPGLDFAAFATVNA